MYDGNIKEIKTKLESLKKEMEDKMKTKEEITGLEIEYKRLWDKLTETIKLKHANVREKESIKNINESNKITRKILEENDKKIRIKGNFQQLV